MAAARLEKRWPAILAQRPQFTSRRRLPPVDTTHIASTVRLARVLDNREELALALDLCAVMVVSLVQVFSIPAKNHLASSI